MTPLGYSYRRMLLKSSRGQVDHDLSRYENLISKSIQDYVDYNQNIIPAGILRQGPDAVKKYKSDLLTRLKAEAKEGQNIIRKSKIPLQQVNNLWTARCLYGASQGHFFQLFNKPGAYCKQLFLGTKYYHSLVCIAPRLFSNRTGLNRIKIQGGAPAFWLMWIILLLISFLLFNANTIMPDEAHSHMPGSPRQQQTSIPR